MKAALLDWDHRDPFDRMIAAVALQERVAVVSADAAFEAVGVERVW
jgi:PIN domain nuclease of toxin-antitoxin system